LPVQKPDDCKSAIFLDTNLVLSPNQQKNLFLPVSGKLNQLLNLLSWQRILEEI